MLDLTNLKEFKHDIQSSNITIYPLIIIGVNTENPLYISTVKETIFDEEGGTPFDFKDYNLKISNIKESINIDTHVFKISNVSVTLNNYEIEKGRLSDVLSDSINSEVEIYYKTQSCKTLSDCLLTYRGLVRRFEHGSEFINMVVEDLTDFTFNKDVPMANFGTRKECYSKKYFNKYIPMVYGAVDKAPIVPYVDSIGNLGEYYISLIADDVDIVTKGGRNISIYNFETSDSYPELSIIPTGRSNGNIENHPLFIYKDDYFRVLQDYEGSFHDAGVINGQEVQIYNDSEQYRIDDSGDFISIKKKYSSGYFQNPPAANELQGFKVHHPNQVEIMTTDLEIDADGVSGVNSSIINIDTSIFRPEASFDNAEKPSLFFDDVVSGEFDTYSEIPYNDLNIDDIEEGLEQFEVFDFIPYRSGSNKKGQWNPLSQTDLMKNNFFYLQSAWLINNAHILNSIEGQECVKIVCLPHIHQLRAKLENLLQTTVGQQLPSLANYIVDVGDEYIKILQQFCVDDYFKDMWCIGSGLSTDPRVKLGTAIYNGGFDHSPAAFSNMDYQESNEDGSRRGSVTYLPSSCGGEWSDCSFDGYFVGNDIVTPQPYNSQTLAWHYYCRGDNPENYFKPGHWFGRHERWETEDDYWDTYTTRTWITNKEAGEGNYYPTTVFKIPVSLSEDSDVDMIDYVYLGQYCAETMSISGTIPESIQQFSDWMATGTLLGNRAIWINLWYDPANPGIPYLYDSIDDFAVYTPQYQIYKEWTGSGNYGIETKYECLWNGTTVEDTYSIDGDSSALVGSDIVSTNKFAHGWGRFTDANGMITQRDICEYQSSDGNIGASWFIYIDKSMDDSNTMTNLNGNNDIGEWLPGGGSKFAKNTLIPMNHKNYVSSWYNAAEGIDTGEAVLFGDNKESETLFAGDVSHAERRLNLCFPFTSIKSKDVIENETNMYFYGKFKTYIDEDDSSDEITINSMTSDDNFLVQVYPASGESEGDIDFNEENVGGNSINLVKIQGDDDAFTSGAELMWETVDGMSETDDNMYTLGGNNNIDSYLMPTWANPDDFNAIGLNYRVQGTFGAKAQMSTDIYSAGLIQFSIFEKALDGNLYADVIGRINSLEDQVDGVYKYVNEFASGDEPVIQNPADIAYHFIEKELNEIDRVDRTSWILGRENSIIQNIAFSLNKKKQSKKLIEEMFRNTNLFPKFGSDGMFYYKYLKREYTSSDLTINTDDILKISFTRTPIEDVVTMARVKYKKDYETNEYTRITGYCDSHDLFGNGDNGGLVYRTFDNLAIGGTAVGWSSYGYDYPSMNLRRDSNILEFESEYIRTYEEAERLRNFLLMQRCNQHTIIKMTIPLKYIDVEVGDVLDFDKLAIGSSSTKAFGEDYTKENIRNGQLIYPYFMATSVIKSPRDIKVECIQLHKLFPSFSPGLGSLSRKSDLGLHGIVLEEGEIEILGQTTDFTLAVNSHFNFDDLALFEKIVANDISYMTSYQKRCADLNGDASMDQYDLNYLLSLFTLAIDDEPESGIDEDVDWNGIIGDANQDGVINVVDIVAIVNYILGAEDANPDIINFIAADITEDGVVNVVDVVGVVNEILR